MIQNFRPGVIEIGLGYEVVRELNPHIVYGEITGYGNTGPLAHQTRSGPPRPIPLWPALAQR